LWDEAFDERARNVLEGRLCSVEVLALLATDCILERN
jgi:hypothetical protein